MIFEVTLKLRVTADSAADAGDWAISAAEHLTDTFNDDESLDPLVAWEVKTFDTEQVKP
jgi:hypothetical protein